MMFGDVMLSMMKWKNAVADEVKRMPWLRASQDAAVCLLAAVSFLIYSLAWPLAPGRDYASYLTFFIQLRDGIVALPDVMSHRAPLVPLLLGIVGGNLGVLALEIVLGTMYVCGALVMYRIGKRFSPAAGWLGALALMVYPTYGWLSHQINSDYAFSFGFLCWALAIIRTAERPTLSAFAWHGLWVFLLTLVRPSGSLFLLFALFPWLLNGLTWKQKSIRTGLFLAVGIGLLLIYSGWSTMKFGGSTAGSNAKAFIPMNRFYTDYKLIKPENGPLSRQMADAVSRHLLPYPPYKNSGVDLETFFARGSGRMLMDMKWLVKEKKVAGGDYAIIRGMAMEAFRRNPGGIIRNELNDLYRLFLGNERIPEKVKAAAGRNSPSSAEKLVSIMKDRLYATSSSEPIPVALSEYLMYTDGEFVKRIDTVQKGIDGLGIRLPGRDGREAVARYLTQFNTGYPSMLWWIIAGLVGLLFLRHQLCRPLLFVLLLAMCAVTLPVMGINNLFFYRIPFDPIFISLGTIGFARLGLRMKPAEN